jgi:hypothetical protein
MTPYHKIQSVFKRDMTNNNKTLLVGQYSRPEFEFLRDCNWIWTEKVDGMNIRVMWNPCGTTPSTGDVRFGGKSDNAQIPTRLFEKLVSTFPLDGSTFRAAFDEGPVCLYGEGYGTGIQAAGKLYGPGQDFVLFDVKVGDWWLKREDVERIAHTMELGIVPVYGVGTLMDMTITVRDSDMISHWYDGPAEGLVARPEVELFARNGQRIITKLKVRDFHDGGLDRKVYF